MTIIQTYTTETLPVHFKWQMRDFARIVWNADVTQKMDSALHPATWHPTYFILSYRELVLSSATVLWKTIDFQGQVFKVYGLGMVMTYPSHRKQGYGRQVVQAATQYIQEQVDVDIALLQTAPHLEKFYAEHGWEHIPSIKILSGALDNPIEDDGWFMLMFLSDDAKQHQSLFEKEPFYFDKKIW